MKYKRTEILLISTIIVSNMLLIYYALTIKRKSESLAIENSMIGNNYENRFLTALDYEDTECYIDSLSSENQPYLCYFVSDLHCKPCVDSILTQINNFSKHQNLGRFALLADYNNANDYIIFKRLHKIKEGVIRIKKANNLIFQTELPLLFIYDSKSHEAEMVFIPDQTKPKLTQKYLDLVYNRYFSR